MTMEYKEIKFWLSVNKVPTYIENIEGMNWENIKSDYIDIQKQLEQEGIKEEIELYHSIINNLKETDVQELLEDGILPEKLLPLINEDFQTGVFKSKKWGIQLGTIYDIIDKAFINLKDIIED
jgi:hypothetical protein